MNKLKQFLYNILYLISQYINTLMCKLGIVKIIIKK